MIVCGHGNVTEYCKNNGMTLVARHIGEIVDYSGDIKVIVTAQEMSLQEFCYLRMAMLSKGYDVRSIHHENIDEKVQEFMEYVSVRERDRRKQTYGGRQPFGFYRKNGEVVENRAMMYVARRIIELRDSGMTLREIQNFPEIHHPDGRKVSVSTIQQIIKNRARYEDGE